MSGKTTGGQELVKVDFDNLPDRHETTIYVPFKTGDGRLGVAELLDTLYRALLLDATYVKIEPPFTSCSSQDNGIVKVPLELRIKFIGSDNPQPLWTFLQNNGFAVIWKHGLQGFRIGPDFTILETWELDDGMC